MIVAPIRVEGMVYGVLDIRGVGSGSFPPHARVMAELLGNQLGLYQFLANTIGKLKQTEAELKVRVRELHETQRQQSQTFEDLAHQLKSPILLAHARAQDILESGLAGDKLQPSLFAIRGLCAKAKRATLSFRLFADLARDQPLQLTLSSLDRFDLIKLLSEAASDQGLLVEPDRRVYFHVDRESFNVLKTMRVSVDRDLLEQAVGNLLDNAGKYSFPNTTVRIYGGATGTGRFHITVLNQGLPIRAHEVSQCILRGWRSDKARLVTGEGSGIGLWIVHNIMAAHGGTLVISPTNAQAENEIKLVFSVR